MRFREHHLALCLLVVAAAMRLLPHPEGIATIGALGLFTGAYLGHRLLFGAYGLMRELPFVYFTPIR